MRRILTATSVILAFLALSACSNSADEPTAEPSTTATANAATSSPTDGQWHNEQDIMFAQMMIPHHEQAIAMADAILSKDGIDPQVVDLATDIKEAQAPEIAQLRTWLTTWGRDDPAVVQPMDHGDAMMGDDDMQALDSAEADEASRLFLEQMIVHHQGAVDMAQALASHAREPEAC